MAKLAEKKQEQEFKKRKTGKAQKEVYSSQSIST